MGLKGGVVRVLGEKEDEDIKTISWYVTAASPLPHNSQESAGQVTTPPHHTHTSHALTPYRKE